MKCFTWNNILMFNNIDFMIMSNEKTNNTLFIVKPQNFSAKIMLNNLSIGDRENIEKKADVYLIRKGQSMNNFFAKALTNKMKSTILNVHYGGK